MEAEAIPCNAWQVLGCGGGEVEEEEGVGLEVTGRGDVVSPGKH